MSFPGSLIGSPRVKCGANHMRRRRKSEVMCAVWYGRVVSPM